MDVCSDITFSSFSLLDVRVYLKPLRSSTPSFLLRSPLLVHSYKLTHSCVYKNLPTTATPPLPPVCTKLFLQQLHLYPLYSLLYITLPKQQ